MYVIKCTFLVAPGCAPLPTTYNTTAWRSSQEAICNVIGDLRFKYWHHINAIGGRNHGRPHHTYTS